MTLISATSEPLGGDQSPCLRRGWGRFVNAACGCRVCRGKSFNNVGYLALYYKVIGLYFGTNAFIATQLIR